MNREIAGDVRFFLAAVALGVAAALVYDLLRIWRRLRKHSLFLLSVQDFIYWFFLGLAGFRMMYYYNAGILRFFAFFGICLGAGLYLVTVSRFFVKYCVRLLRFFGLPLQKGLLFLKKQGKLWVRNRSRLAKKRNEHGRKDALAEKKGKKKDRV